MKAICEYSNEEYEAARSRYMELYEKTRNYKRDELLVNYTRKFGYAHYTFRGYIGDKLIEALGRMPTADEIIMLVDGGFSHFGATCTISGRNFSGKVCTD